MQRISSGGIPYLDWGGEGPPLHFAHANGFPPGTYSSFVASLTTQFHVLGMECRALWGNHDPAQFQHWREMGEDLARFVLETGLGPIIAAGHSLGAVTSLFCALNHPELVRALVLIDPVILPAYLLPVWPIVQWLGLNRRARHPAGARRRRLDWPSREAIYRAYRRAPVFSRWMDTFLHDYVTSGTEELPSGKVRLRYPREWEARVFETPPLDAWLHMRRLRNVPLLVLRGQDSETYTRGSMKLMRRLLPHGTFMEIEGADHFVPMSRPAEATAAMLAFLQEHAGATGSQPSGASPG